MQELLEQAIDFLRGIWVKRRYIIISTWLICPIGWFLVALPIQLGVQYWVREKEYTFSAHLVLVHFLFFGVFALQ